jgi:hypothetical protein
MLDNEADPYRRPQIQFVRPREMKRAHIFKVLIHIDVVDDLAFYHYLREELLVDGKTPWREFECLVVKYRMMTGPTNQRLQAIHSAYKKP